MIRCFWQQTDCWREKRSTSSWDKFCQLYYTEKLLGICQKICNYSSPAQKTWKWFGLLVIKLYISCGVSGAPTAALRENASVSRYSITLLVVSLGIKAVCLCFTHQLIMIKWNPDNIKVKFRQMGLNGEWICESEKSKRSGNIYIIKELLLKNLFSLFSVLHHQHLWIH